MDGRKIRNMEEFAAVSGISRPTVSKYFNDPGSVRPSTRARIEAALEDYDYRPNIYAMNQNRRLTKSIGIVVPYLADPVFAEIARSVERRCMEAGFRTSLFSSHGEQAHENDVLDSLRALRPAGGDHRRLLSVLMRTTRRPVRRSMSSEVTCRRSTSTAKTVRSTAKFESFAFVFWKTRVPSKDSRLS